jgi:hypothetical protein
MFGIASFSQAPFSSLAGGQTQLASASVNATATVTALGFRILPFSAAVTGNATITANGNRLQFGNAVVNCTGTVSDSEQVVQLYHAMLLLL